MTDYEMILKQGEELLRAGKPHGLLALLKNVTLRSVPWAYRARLANLCRRADLIDKGLALLAPVVRPERKQLDAPATIEEKAEYAVLLARTGAVQESTTLLQSLDASLMPEVNLYLAFNHFSVWEYNEALPYLEKFSANAPTPYMAIVASVNTAAALIATGDFAHAIKVLDETLDRCRAGSHLRLMGNCLELRAQIFVAQKDFNAAFIDLEQALHCLGGQQNAEELYVRKWQAVTLALSQNDPQPLIDFKASAIARSDWENVRDAEFFLLKVRFNQESFDRLLFGTPNPVFAAKLLAAFPAARVKDSAVFNDGADVFDLQSGTVVRAGEMPSVLAHGKVHELLYALGRDFYRPRLVGSLFAELYPGEYFDIFSSPQRVHQLLRRARRLIEANGLSLTIERRGQGYILAGEIGLDVPRRRSSVARNDDQFEKLKRTLPRGRKLSAGQIQRALDFTPGEFRWFVESAVNAGVLIRTGQRAGTRYKLAPAA